MRQFAGAVASVSLIAAGGYVINDYFDLPIDIINRPDRPLPRGLLTPQQAYMYAALLFVLGVCASAVTGSMVCVGMALLNTLLLFFYARNLKMSFLWGNLIVAWAAAATFLYGAAAAGSVSAVMGLSVYAFLFTLLREVIKDREDVPGDIKLGAKTLAVVGGRTYTRLFYQIVMLGAVTLTGFLTWSGYLSLIAVLAMVLTALLPSWWLGRQAFTRDTTEAYAKASGGLKLVMLAVLLTYWLNSL